MDIGLLAAHISFNRHGGANYSKHLLGQMLEKRGHDATYYTLNFSDENDAPASRAYDIVELKLEGPGLAGKAGDLLRQLRGVVSAHDVFHVYIPGPIPLVALAAKGTGTPVVTTLNGYTPFCTNSSLMSHGCWEECSLRDKIVHGRMGPQGKAGQEAMARHVFNHFAGMRLMDHVDRHICLSPAVADIYEGAGVDGSLLDVIPNMVDPGMEVPDIGGNGVPHVLYAGRLDPGKGVGLLLDAMGRIDKDFQLDIVGDDVLGFSENGLEGYRERAEQAGVADKTVFHGWVNYDVLPNYYAKADLFVHPGTWPEPFGRTIIEAMQNGVPIACSDTGAPPWVAGSSCRTFRAGDPADMARRIGRLLRMPDARAALSANAETELRRFEPDRVTDQIIATYEEVA
jgi:starch synthase